MANERPLKEAQKGSVGQLSPQNPAIFRINHRVTAGSSGKPCNEGATKGRGAGVGMKMQSRTQSVIFALALSAISLLAAGPQTSEAAVVNGGFEAPLVIDFSSSPPYLVPPNYVYIPPSAGNTPTLADSWTYNLGAGLINGNNPGAFNGESGFVGGQYAFIQGQGSYISQVFSATPGIGRIDWLQAGRPSNGCCNGDQTLSVFLNGLLVGTVASTSNQPFTAESIIGVALLASNTLQFLGTVAADETAFIDEVSVTTTTPTPLPAAWTMMLIGFFGFGFFARRGMKSCSPAVAAA